MTKAIFINDHPFYTADKMRFYTSGTLNYKVWERFTNHFGALTVIGRGSIVENNECEKYQLSSAHNVSFDLFYNIKGGIDYFRYKNEIKEKLKKYIKESEFIILRLPSNIGLIAANLCYKYKRKYLVEVVGNAFDSLWYYGNYQAKILAPIVNFFTKKAVWNCSAAVYVTEEYLQKKYPTKSPYINASNVVLDFVPDDVLYKHQILLNTESNKKNLGMIGNVAVSYKGYRMLLRALSNVHLNYTLYLIGGGNTSYITKLIKKYNLQDKVVLLGRINEKDKLMETLDSLSLYLQPSLTEGLPRSVIEAMSRACPIVASDAGGIPELIGSCFIYDKNNSNELRDLIIKVLSKSDMLMEMSRDNFSNSRKYLYKTIKERRMIFFDKVKNNIRNTL